MVTKEELAAELLKGRDLISKGAYDEAAEALSTTCEKYVSKYGEMACETAESYLRYGIALTREVEMEEEKAGGQDVLGASVPKEIATGVAPDAPAAEGEGAAAEGDAKAEDKAGEGEGEEGE
eukprot:CAMPEP_0114127632 /NCGR_PEP_ID=MMETSP0043_2-20121206/10489_1 /TAXON_ID=464988 /ORGANISM="Hemiselmis andersenii, Strain CCMP644" /LENGTH=121 /DNA_ID=CAMNT_0001220741 /DNA_START=36 /DNA_END=398 /DNA_ORIENTATION=-